MPKAYLEIDPRKYGEPGYFVKGNHPYLGGFSSVEEDPKTDFSFTAKLVEEYLNVNYSDHAPYKLTFHPEDRSRWTQFSVIEILWERRTSQ